MYANYLIVIQGVVHCCISFHGNGNCHENRCCHHDHLARVEEAGKQVGMQRGDQVEAFSEALQDRAKEVANVEDGQRNQQQIEAVLHFTVCQNYRGYDVANQATNSHARLQNPLHPKAEFSQDLFSFDIIVRAIGL